MFYFETELLLCTVMSVRSLPANSTQLLAPNAYMLILLSQLLALFVNTDWLALNSSTLGHVSTTLKNQFLTKRTRNWMKNCCMTFFLFFMEFLSVVLLHSWCNPFKRGASLWPRIPLYLAQGSFLSWSLPNLVRPIADYCRTFFSWHFVSKVVSVTAWVCQLSCIGSIFT